MDPAVLTRCAFTYCALGLGWALAQPAVAAHGQRQPERTAPGAEFSACFAAAASFHGVSEPLLRSIAKQESGMNPWAWRRNTNGSHDVGLMQINSSWYPALARQGIAPELLRQPCPNIYVGAWILAMNLRDYGDSWQALGRYHSATPELNRRYAWAVYQRLKSSAPAPP